MSRCAGLRIAAAMPHSVWPLVTQTLLYQPSWPLRTFFISSWRSVRIFTTLKLLFLSGDCAPLRWDARGGPPSMSPRWLLAEQATQPRNLLTQPPCPRLSPPRRCRHPEFSSSLTSSLGSDSTIFLRPSTLSRQRAVVVPGISSSPCYRDMRPPSGRPARRAAAVSTPLPGPPPLAYFFGPPRQDELPCLASSGRANHLYAAWPCNLFLSSPPSLHLRTVAGALAK